MKDVSSPKIPVPLSEKKAPEETRAAFWRSLFGKPSSGLDHSPLPALHPQPGVSNFLNKGVNSILPGQRELEKPRAQLRGCR